MYVFAIDIPFKRSKSLLNLRSRVTPLCSACHSGVMDTAVKSTLSIFFVNSKPYSKRPVDQGPRGSCLI
jgi:hypothetical protein